MSNQTYAENCERLRFYDISPEGKERLRLGKMRGGRAGSGPKKCTVCNWDRHTAERCWVAHSELKKAWKEQKGNNSKPWGKNKFKEKIAAKSTPRFAGKKKPFTFPKPSITTLSGNVETTDDRIFVGSLRIAYPAREDGFLKATEGYSLCSTWSHTYSGSSRLNRSRG